MTAFGQPRCIENRASAEVKVGICFAGISRIRKWVGARQIQCIPYNKSLPGIATSFLRRVIAFSFLFQGKEWFDLLRACRVQWFCGRVEKIGSDDPGAGRGGEDVVADASEPHQTGIGQGVSDLFGP